MRKRVGCPRGGCGSEVDSATDRWGVEEERGSQRGRKVRMRMNLNVKGRGR